MGTTWTARWIPGSGEVTAAEVRVAVQGALDEVDGAMSTYEPASELMQLNVHVGEGPVEVSSLLMEVLVEARTIHGWSQGAFDVTVAPLVRAWGFGHQPDAAPPDDRALAGLRARIGQGHLELAPAPAGGGKVRKLHPDVTVDLSALAKGYGADRAAERIGSLGITALMIEVGGEVRVVGDRGGEPWRIGVETPDGGPQDVRLVVPLVDASMATSGDYRQVNWVDGEPVSHTLDPRTGRPVSHRLASVTVVALTAMRADALATALMVLGPGAGLELAEARGWPALFMVHAPEGGFVDKATSHWRLMLAGPQPGGAH